MTETMYYPVKGAIGKEDDGDVPARRSVHDLYKNKEQWELYLLGLRKWYDMDPKKLLSYFQIAGIHGMPYTRWNNEVTQKIGGDDEKNSIGYCTHTTVLFPSWHRPYLILYEQRLQEVMLQDIVPKIPEPARAKYQRAAETWRMPYWDWAEAGPELTKDAAATADAIKHKWLPPLSWQETVDINIPGHEGTIANPLHKFTVPGEKQMKEYAVGTIKTDDPDEIMYGNTAGLSRCPKQKYYYRDNYDGGNKVFLEKHIEEKKIKIDETKDWAAKWQKGEIDNEQIYANFKDMPWVVFLPPNDQSKEKFQKFNNHHRAGENVYRMMQYSTDYNNFATAGGLPDISTGKVPEGQWYQSLEAIHNTVHWWVGGGNNGHMSQVPVASFDPFFWMHHTNIERFYCTWQYLHKDDPEDTQWFKAVQENVANTSGVKVDVNGEPMDPNRKDQKPLMRERGPNTPLSPFRRDKDNMLTSNDVRDFTKFNYTYPQLQKKGLNDEQLKRKIWAELNQKYSPYRQQVLSSGQSPKGDLEIVVNLTYNKYLFHGKPFVINLYLCKGDTKNPLEEQIGDVYNFSAPGSNAGKPVCSNCIQLEQSEIKCRSQITISHLKPYFKEIEPNLDIDSEDAIEKFLKERLYVMVYATSGRAIGFQNEKQPVTVSVATTRVTYDADDEKPTGYNAFKTFASLAGNVADLLLIPPGAIVLSVTGNVIGVLDNTGKVAGKAIQDVTGIANKGFDDVLKLGFGVVGGALGTASNVTQGVFNVLGGGGDKKDQGGSGGGLFGGRGGGGLF